MKKLYIFLSLVIATVAYSATTYTTNYNLAKPGDRDRNYGSLIRENFDTIDTQMQNNADSISNHMSDAVGAHAATAISTTAGSNICTTQTTVQAYLNCLDSLLDPTASGVVLLIGSQTITGLKTFSITPVFPSVPSGILNTDGGGIISASSFTSLSPLTIKGDLLTYNTSAARLAVGSDGQQLVADSTSATGLKWDTPNPRWRKFTFGYNDFSAASNSFSVTAFSLAAEEGLDAVIIKHSAAFGGGTSTAYTVEVGVAGDTNQYAGAFNTFQAPGNTVREVTNILDVPNFGVSTDVVVTARASGDTLNNITTGSVDVYIRTFVLP